MSMIEDFFFDNLDTFDDIDTSEVDIDDGLVGDSSDFYDSFMVTDELEIDCYDDIHGFSSETYDDDLVETHTEHHHESNKTSQISFTGLGRCRVCNCGGWAGYGDTCENCGHFFNKHI